MTSPNPLNTAPGDWRVRRTQQGAERDNAAPLRQPHGVQKFAPWAGILAGAGLAVVLGYADYATGPEISFSIFYLVPISLTVWLSGRLAGLAVSLISAIIWMVADQASGQTYSHALVPYWNAAVRFGYFTLHTLLMSLLLASLAREKIKALFDALTGAANWRHFEEYSRRQIERDRRYHQPVTVAYLDLDNFKVINDRLGHAAGDDLLRTMAEIIHGQIRTADMLARLGGDEFALLLPDTGYEAAGTVLQRIHRSVDAELARRDVPITLSIGAITCDALPLSVEALIQRADEMMYAVKRAGKNGVRHERWAPAPAAPAQQTK